LRIGKTGIFFVSLDNSGFTLPQELCDQNESKNKPSDLNGNNSKIGTPIAVVEISVYEASKL
jgi:hypothetical protein